ncbi:MAG: hypothetical protein IJY39_00605 [Clostridia bacterium]|nr:hypothetical protein [Clostridia bacterium]
MKKILTVLVLSILLTALQSCQTNDPVDSTETTQPVASENTSEESTESAVSNLPRVLIRFISYDASEAETSKTEYIYDKYGNEACALFYSNGELVQSSKYTYDQNQRLIKTVDTEHSTEQSFIYEYEYDINGNKLTETITATHGYLSRRAYEYDKLNRVVKVTSSTNDSETVFTYDPDNSCVILDRYEYNGEVIFNQTKEKYNENGDVIYRAAYYQNSLVDIEYETVNIYNAYGLLQTSETYAGDELVMSTSNEYNGDLLVRSTSADAEGVYLISEYEYNQYGELIKQINKLPSGLVIGYSEYEYAELHP